MNWSNTRVLVTGAGGFIGSHLCERLVNLGAKVRAFVRYTSKSSHGCLELLSPDIYREIEVFLGDIRSIERVRDAVLGVDFIFHLAALIAIPYSYLDPRDYAETNVLGGLNILTAAREHQVSKLIMTSTSEVFGTAKYAPIDELHPLQGQSPYSASKIAIDKFAQSFFCSYNLPVVILRPFNTYGPRQSARAIIPTIISQALSGNQLKLGSLHPTRDFTFVKDTAEGFILAAEKGVNGEDYNIGNGKEISVKMLVEQIGKLLGKSLTVIQQEERVRPLNSEVERLTANPQKAKIVLGWEPKITLEQGLKQTIVWIQEQKHLYKTEVYTI